APCPCGPEASAERGPRAPKTLACEAAMPGLGFCNAKSFHCFLCGAHLERPSEAGLPVSLPSLGVSSLDLGRTDLRAAPFLGHRACSAQGAVRAPRCYYPEAAATPARAGATGAGTPAAPMPVMFSPGGSTLAHGAVGA